MAEKLAEHSSTSFRPFIPDRTKLRELTILPLIFGTLLGIVFGASSLYLVLKTGLTVSASIPVAVISITIFALVFGATFLVTAPLTVLFVSQYFGAFVKCESDGYARIVFDDSAQLLPAH